MDASVKKIQINLSAHVIQAIHEIIMSVSLPAKQTLPILKELESEINRVNVELTKKEGDE